MVKNAFDFGHKRDPERHQAVLANNINLWNLDELNEMVRMTSDFTYHYMSIVPTSPTHAELKSICLSDENRSEFVAATKKAQNLADELGVNIVFQETWPKSQ